MDGRMLMMRIDGCLNLPARERSGQTFPVTRSGFSLLFSGQPIDLKEHILAQGASAFKITRCPCS